MKNLKKIEEEIKILGYYQVAGGIVGIGFLIFEIIGILGQDSKKLEEFIVYIIMITPFLLSIYAGIQCIKDKSNKLLLSKINQALQVISFSLAGFGLTYCSGVYFAVGIDLTNDFMFKFNFGLSSVNLEFNTLSKSSFVLVNVIAFYLVYKIIGYEHTIEEYKNLDIEEHLISK